MKSERCKAFRLAGIALRFKSHEVVGSQIHEAAAREIPVVLIGVNGAASITASEEGIVVRVWAVIAHWMMATFTESVQINTFLGSSTGESRVEFGQHHPARQGIEHL